MEAAYAQALWQMVEGGMTPSKAVHALHETLVSQGRAALMPRVSRAFERLSLREAGKNDVVLTIARESDERAAHKEVKELLSKFGVDAHDLKTRVDDTLIGGWRLEGRETLIDVSHKQQLLEMYSRAANA